MPSVLAASSSFIFMMVRHHERGALAGRQAVDDRGHAALLELPQQEVALGLGQRADDIGARRLAAQRVVEHVEAHLGRSRQLLLEDVVGDAEQPELGLAPRPEAVSADVGAQERSPRRPRALARDPDTSRKREVEQGAPVIGDDLLEFLMACRSIRATTIPRTCRATASHLLPGAMRWQCRWKSTGCEKVARAEATACQHRLSATDVGDRRLLRLDARLGGAAAREPRRSTT